MKVFVSWSGRLSREIALLLREYLPNILQSVELFMSEEDISKGSLWANSISKELEASGFGIICVTRSNRSEPWLLFEAGALAKQVEKACVAPLLINLSAADVTGPLSIFQSTAVKEGEIIKLISSVNKLLGDKQLPETRMKTICEKFLPDLLSKINKAVSSSDLDSPPPQKRNSEELLEEVLQNTRTLLRNLENRPIDIGYLSGSPYTVLTSTEHLPESPFTISSNYTNTPITLSSSIPTANETRSSIILQGRPLSFTSGVEKAKEKTSKDR